MNASYDTPDDVVDSHTPPPESESAPPAEEESYAPPEGESAPPSGEQAPPPAADDPFAQWGGRDAVEEAMLAWDSLSTREGITANAIESLRALGYPEEQIIQFIQGGFVQEQTQDTNQGVFEGLNDDDVLTVADAKRLIDQELGRGLEPIVQSYEQQRQDQADLAVQGTLQALGINPGSTSAQGVLVHASRYLYEDEWDPQAISSAVRRGAADYMAEVQAEANRYLAAKAATRDALPSNIGGHNSGVGQGTLGDEPKDLREGIARAREQIRRLSSGQ